MLVISHLMVCVFVAYDSCVEWTHSVDLGQLSNGGQKYYPQLFIFLYCGCLQHHHLIGIILMEQTDRLTICPMQRADQGLFSGQRT